MTTEHRRTAAFSLVEVVLALGVASFCLMAVFALLPIGMQSNRAAVGQTASTAILSSVVADLRATPAAGSSTQFKISKGSTTTLYFDSEGRASSAIRADSRYRVTVTFRSPAFKYSPTFAHVAVTWPAAADPAKAAGQSATLAAIPHP